MKFEYIFGLFLALLSLLGFTAKIYPLVLLFIISFLLKPEKFSKEFLILLPILISLISYRFFLCNTNDCIDNQLILIILQTLVFFIPVFSKNKIRSSTLDFIIYSTKIAIIIICFVTLIGNFCTFLGISFPYDLFDMSAYRKLRKLAIFFAPPVSKTILFSIPLFIYPKLEKLPIGLIGLTLLMTKTRTELLLLITIILFILFKNLIFNFYKNIFYSQKLVIKKSIFTKINLKKGFNFGIISSSLFSFFFVIREKLFSSKGFLTVSYKNLFGGDVDGGSLYLRYLKIGPFCQEFVNGSYLFGLSQKLSFGIEPLLILIPCKFGLLIFIPWLISILIYIYYVNKFSFQLAIIISIIISSTFINFYFISISSTYFLTLFIVNLKNQEKLSDKYIS